MSVFALSKRGPYNAQSERPKTLLQPHFKIMKECNVTETSQCENVLYTSQGKQHIIQIKFTNVCCPDHIHDRFLSQVDITCEIPDLGNCCLIALGWWHKHAACNGPETNS